MSIHADDEATWADVQKAIDAHRIFPGARVRVRADVANEDQYDCVEDYAGMAGTVEHKHGDGGWCVALDGHHHSTRLYTHELEVIA